MTKMTTERTLELAGLQEATLNITGAQRLAREILPAADQLVNRAQGVLGRFDPVRDKLFRDMVLDQVFDTIKTKV